MTTQTKTQTRKYAFSFFTFLFILFFAHSSFVQGQTRGEAMEARNKGAAAMQDYFYDDAVEAFEEALEIARALGDDALDIKTEIEGILASAYYNLAREYVRSNDANKAIGAFEKAIEAGKEFGNDNVVANSKDGISKLYFAVGNSHRQNQQLDNALSSYNKAIEYNPDYAAGYLGKALVYMSQNKPGEFEQALLTAKEKAEIENDQRTLGMIQQVAIRFYYNNAVRARQATRYEESAQQLEKTLEFHPEYEDAYFLMSLVKNELGSFAEAQQAAERALELAEDKNNEEKARLYFQLARAFQGKNMNQDACAAYKQAALGDYKAQSEYARQHVLKCE